MVSTRQSRMDIVRERADSLRELDLDDVGQGLGQGLDKAHSGSQLQDNKEEDDIAIASAIADVEEEIKAGDQMVAIPLAFVLAFVAWFFRNELSPVLEYLLGPVGKK